MIDAAGKGEGLGRAMRGNVRRRARNDKIAHREISFAEKKATADREIVVVRIDIVGRCIARRARKSRSQKSKCDFCRVRLRWKMS